ncbi:PREDICTED: UPF0258 protein KIAA1024 homolog [Myotis brandtii]|uniref:UPF0258 protein KIAA1024 homolog n=1 Tax=Myotis brandtii TaxID=109478 RepID=UPI000703E8A5|nr:PREDICTED: UPF0258 protein KIAA1024 homolog [Myotis brandtii]
MEAGPDTSLFLVKILEELDSKHSNVSYQDLCKSLCARFDLPQLARLRSVLFYTACLDPGFPATLFKDKMKCPGNNQQSKKIMVAADIVTIFNLIQMTGGAARERLPPAVASPQPCEMQRTYFPMTLDSEPVSDQDSLPGPPDIKGTFVANVDDDGPFGVQSCVQKRSIFKEDFHNLMPVSPGLVGPANKAEGEHGDPQSRKELPKAPFFNHSFEMPYHGRYLNAVYSPVPDKRRAKHESLDDLQASTYFGPTPVMGTQEARRCPGGRPGKQTPWPAKSWSLNTEEVPDFERPEPKTRRDLPGKYGDRPAARQSDDDSEVVSDDISDIFRFLDDMSASGSTGVIPSSCYNSTGSLSQLPKSDGDSSGLAGSQGEKGKRPEPGHRSEEELKTSVCRLVLRVGEIERKLESLSGVREEICQVLGKLNKLGQKMQPPETARVQVDLNSLTSGALRVKALKKSLFARPSSRSLTEENSATESKIASISNSPRDWRTITYANRLGLDEEEEEVRDRGPGESKDWRRKHKEADRQYDVPPQHRRPKQPRDFLVEQVFSPHPYPTSLKAHLKSNPLYTDMRLTELAEVRRGQPSWAVEEYMDAAGTERASSCWGRRDRMFGWWGPWARMNVSDDLLRNHGSGVETAASCEPTAEARVSGTWGASEAMVLESRGGPVAGVCSREAWSCGTIWALLRGDQPRTEDSRAARRRNDERKPAPSSPASQSLSGLQGV